MAGAGRCASEAEQSALVAPAGVPCPPDATGWAVVRQQVTDRISSTHADPLKTRLLSRLLAGPVQACVLGGGVDSYEPSSSTTSGGRATLQARIGIWSRFSRRPDEAAVEPHGLEDCTSQLVRAGGGWLVSDDRCTFVPGHGP